MKNSIFFLLSCSIFLSVVFLTGCGRKAPTVDTQKMQLALKDTLYYQRGISPEAGAERLQALLKEYPNLTDWEERKKCLREGLLTAMELNPLPPKTPLKPLYTGHHSFERYTVDNVAFECVPGLWVIGNLYKPSGERANCPAVLLAHGHGKREPLEECSRFLAYRQYLAAAHDARIKLRRLFPSIDG